jgi:Domain of unknown function (DUF4403)
MLQPPFTAARTTPAPTRIVPPPGPHQCGKSILAGQFVPSGSLHHFEMNYPNPQQRGAVIMHRFRKVLESLVLATLAFALAACSGVRPLIAEPPREEAFRTALKKEVSTLNVSIEAATDDLGKLLNQSVRKELYKGSTGTRGVSADILRNGPIVVGAADNFLYFTIPINMTLSYGMFETPAMTMKLKFKATARITPDWQMHTEIYYLGLSDLLAEEIGIGPISIRPRGIVDGLTQPVQKLLSELLSKKVNELFPLRNQVARAWNAAQQPVLLDKNYNAWLTMTPREVMLSPLVARNNRVLVSAGITSFAEVVVGPQPPSRPPVPLPNLKPVNSFDKNFRIALNADLFYRDILNIASPLLLNREFKADGKSITLTDLDLYGNGDKVIVKVATKGALEGVFYLTGLPRFNPRTDVLSVEDVDFDMQSQGLLLQSADWFLHGAIRGMIQEKLNVDLTQRLEQSRKAAEKAIANVQLAEHLLLRGTIKTLKFSDVLVQKDKISVQVYTDGEAAIVFQ